MNRVAQSKRKVKSRRGHELHEVALLLTDSKPVTVMLVSVYDYWYVQGESYLG